MVYNMKRRVIFREPLNLARFLSSFVARRSILQGDAGSLKSKRHAEVLIMCGQQHWAKNNLDVFANKLNPQYVTMISVSADVKGERSSCARRAARPSIYDIE